MQILVVTRDSMFRVVKLKVKVCAEADSCVSMELQCVMVVVVDNKLLCLLVRSGEYITVRGICATYRCDRASVCYRRN